MNITVTACHVPGRKPIRCIIVFLVLTLALAPVRAHYHPLTQTTHATLTIASAEQTSFRDTTAATAVSGQPSLASRSAKSKGLAEQVEGASDSTGFVAGILKWYDANMSYWAVGALMTIESSFIPFPSEVVIPPAVFIAANPESAGHMKIWVIVLIGTLGALLGAFINYYLSRWLGRPVIYAFVNSKPGHLLMLSGEKMEKAERYFNDHGNISTLIGRLVPVVRQLISIPAGLSKMPVVPFALFTFMGALAWNIVLAIIGYYAYKIGQLSIIKEYSHLVSIVLLALMCAVIAFLIVRSVIKKKKKKQAGTEANKQ